MSATSTNTRQVHRRIGAGTRKLKGFFLLALLLPAVPASASGLVMRETAPAWDLADADAQGANGCALPPLSVRIDNPLVLSSSTGKVSAVDYFPVKNRWASGATSHWNAGMNRAVDQLVSPPDHVNVYATQTGDDLHGHFEGTNGPNETLAAFAVVIY